MSVKRSYLLSQQPQLCFFLFLYCLRNTKGRKVVHDKSLDVLKI